jgi:hypothetical protein
VADGKLNDSRFWNDGKSRDISGIVFLAIRSRDTMRESMELGGLIYVISDERTRPQDQNKTDFG